MKFFVVFILFLVLNAIQQLHAVEYTLHKNKSIRPEYRQRWLINKGYRVIDEISCLVYCNINDECRVAIFINDPTMKTNCYLHRKYFTPDEQLNSTTSVLYTSECYGGLVSTFGNVACVTRPKRLSDVFDWYQLQHTLLNYTNQPFRQLNSFQLVSTDVETRNYVLQYADPNILIYDQDWNFIRSDNSLGGAATYSALIENELFLTITDRIYKADKSLKVNKTYTVPGVYRGMYYNKTSDLIHVALEFAKQIDIFNRNLELIDSINTTIYSAFSISGYQSQLYVGTSNTGNKILVIENKQIVKLIEAPCGFISYLLFDTFDYMMIVCRSAPTLHLYHINGTNTGKSLAAPGEAMYANFDSKGRLVITTLSSIIIYY